VLAEFSRAGVDLPALAARLQEEGAASFVKSWTDLMDCIEEEHRHPQGELTATNEAAVSGDGLPELSERGECSM
jgi:hypothetical protein